MSAEAIAFFIAGLIQSPLQELLIRNRLEGPRAAAATIAVSLLLALAATWITGGFAGGMVPAFSLADPSPLLGFLVAKLTPVYALSQLVFSLFNKQVHA